MLLLMKLISTALTVEKLNKMMEAQTNNNELTMEAEITPVVAPHPVMNMNPPRYPTPRPW